MLHVRSLRLVRVGLPRSSRRRCAAVLLVCAGLAGAAALCALLLLGDSNSSSGGAVARCEPDSELQAAQMRLLLASARTLHALNVTHFLCYGALWAALRTGRLFPWTSRVELCALNDDLRPHDEVYFRRQFRRQDLSVEYGAAEGHYEVSELGGGGGSRGEARLLIVLFALEQQLGLARRQGFKYRLMPPTADNIDSFPVRLIAKPLNVVRLHGAAFPAPREGIEIQKYHYKHNWWKEIRPHHCK